jgi:hypothetical protein
MACYQYTLFPARTPIVLTRNGRGALQPSPMRGVRRNQEASPNQDAIQPHRQLRQNTAGVVMPDALMPRIGK